MATITLETVYNELKALRTRMGSKKDIRSLIETIDVLGNPETMRQLAQSADDVRNSHVKEVDSANDLLAEL